MLKHYETIKMDVQPGSEWYVMSLDWFSRWKRYVDFDQTGEPGEFPGPILQNDIVDTDAEVQVVIDQDNEHVNINLRDNLREETHFIILGHEVWTFLFERYGGREIKRFGVQTESGEP